MIMKIIVDAISFLGEDDVCGRLRDRAESPVNVQVHIRAKIFNDRS